MTDTAKAQTRPRPQTIAEAATAAHWNGLHSAHADIHCPVCIDAGYVGAGFDRERIATGSA